MAATRSQALAAQARFAGFELDFRSGELTCNGRRLRLQDQSFRLLKILLENAGEVVTREELQRQLWPAETFVDFEHGLNKAIAKLRDILEHENADSSLIETLPRRGYRFTGSVEWMAPVRPGDGSEPGRVSEAPKARWRLFVAASAVLVLIAVGLLVRTRFSHSSVQVQPIHSIAVLPLVNLSGEKSQDYFADGMTDELITMLAKNTSLRVISRTSVMRYKGVSRPIHDIARELGTDGILEGSISRSANRVHLTVQLVQGENDTHIWADSYDRDLSDAASLLSDLSQTIAKEVKVATSPQSQPQRKINPAALDAYLRGRQFWFDVGYGQSQDFFRKAIELQPDYAAAWSGLADVYTVKAVAGDAPTAEVREQAEKAARKGLELDDSLGDAHKSMAAVHYFLEWNWKAAEAESRRALELNPNDSESHHLRSYVLETLNRPEEALQEQKRASELDPDLRPWALGRAYIHLRQYDAAIKELRARAEVHQHAPALHHLLANAYHFAGMAKESVQEYESIYRSDNDTDAAEAVQREFKRGGERAFETWQLNRWKKIVGRGYVDPTGFAAAYARIGRKEEALAALEQAYQERSAELVWLQNYPDFDSLHSDDRYRAIVKEMNLPPAY